MFCILRRIECGCVRRRAQTTTASIRGQVRNLDPKTAVVARDIATDETVTATVDPQGRYALNGLHPGTYRLSFRVGQRLGAQPGRHRRHRSIPDARSGWGRRHGVHDGPHRRRIGSSPARRLIETRTSEVATNVSTQQIRDLPQTDRNFLSFAALAPGVHYNDSEYTRTFTAGGGQSGGRQCLHRRAQPKERCGARWSRRTGGQPGQSVPSARGVGIPDAGAELQGPNTSRPRPRSYRR